MGQFIDKTGQKFNKLTAKKYLGNSLWLCDCECGNRDIVVRGVYLNEVPGRRKIKSCGCLLTKNIPKKEDYFTKIDTQEKAYILGFIAADGSVTGKEIKIDLKDVDEDILIKIQKEIGHTNNLSHYTNKGIKFKNNNKIYNCKIARLVIHSERMVEDLKQYGIVNCKSNILDIKIDKIPKDFVFGFLRGYFDGDGCLSFSEEKRYVNLTFTSSTAMIEKLKQIIYENCDIKGKLFIQHRHENNLSNATLICHNKKDVMIILNFMYNSPTIYLNRKYEKVKQFKSIFGWINSNDYPLGVQIE